jgi:AcrR family transcriptional regulator
MSRIENHTEPARRQSATQEPLPGASDTKLQLPRKEREIRRHRQELLEASESLLASKRFHEITVQDIAIESEFSVGYIYKLFPNKDEILATLIRTKLAELRSLIEENLAGEEDWNERLLRMLEVMFRWLEETPAYRSGACPDVDLFARTHPAVAADMSGFMRFFENRIQLLFSEAVRVGDLAEDEPGVIARTSLALVTGFSDDKLAELRPQESLTKYAPLIVSVISRAFAPEERGR